MKLYSFDFDDTIVATDCKILTNFGFVSTAQFASGKFSAISFDDFKRLDCSIEPSFFFNTFITALKLKHPVSIITARSNSKEEIEILLKRVADMGGAQLHEDIHIYPCNSEGFQFQGSTSERKCQSLLDFANNYPDAESIGFSDDDNDNIECVSKFFQNMNHPIKRKIYCVPSKMDIV